MTGWLRRLLAARVVWSPVPDHESPSLLCRLAWHDWVVTTHRIRELGRRELVVVGRVRECRACGCVESEVRLS